MINYLNDEISQNLYVTLSMRLLLKLRSALLIIIEGFNCIIGKFQTLIIINGLSNSTQRPQIRIFFVAADNLKKNIRI